MSSIVEPEYRRLVTTSEAEKLLGVTKQWLGQLKKGGWIAPEVRGRWDRDKLYQGQAAFLKDAARRSAKAQVANKGTDARTCEFELRISNQGATLIRYDEAVGVIDSVAGEFLTLNSSPGLRQRSSGGSGGCLWFQNEADALASYRVTDNRLERGMI